MITKIIKIYLLKLIKWLISREIKYKELELLKDKTKITKQLKDLKNLEMAQIELKRINS